MSIDPKYLQAKYPEQWRLLKVNLEGKSFPIKSIAGMKKWENYYPVNVCIPTLGLREQIFDTIDSLLTSSTNHFKIIVVVQANENMAKRLNKRYVGIDCIEIISEPTNRGWVWAQNMIAKRNGNLFALSDDVIVTRKTIESLCIAIGEYFKDTDGILGTKLTDTLIQDKYGFPGAFPFIGDKFINRFPGRQVFCPDYFSYASDVELPDFAISIGKCFCIEEAQVIHLARSTSGNEDETSQITRGKGMDDIETYFIRQDKCYCWGENFELLNKTKFLSILTRVHPARPMCLKRNIKSVNDQTDNDVQHLLIRPEIEENDVVKAGPPIHCAKYLVLGKYVMTLDDDDMLANPQFIEKLKVEIGKTDADMVIFRCNLGDKILPPDNYWNKRELKLAMIAGPNVAVKREIYDKASHEWLRPVYESDWYYIETAFKISKKVLWWDFLGTCSQGVNKNNVGKPEKLFKVRPTIGG